MKIPPPLKLRTDLPSALRGMPGRYFTTRHPATHAEAERDDVIFGVKSLNDLLERASRTRSAPDKLK